jgi:uracil phosphoribosyltransferase
MLATGGSAAAAVSSLKRAGATRIRFLCLVAAPEGVKRLSAEHPDVQVYCAALDRELNTQGYIPARDLVTQATGCSALADR